jgi:Uma2 family endonuclease
MMSNALQYSPHYTVVDYQHWKGDWELWEGIAIAMSPSPFGRHQTLLSRIATLLAVALEKASCNAEMLVELDWIVTNDTVVRPDVVVVCGEPPQRHLEYAPAIAVEVLSDSTRNNDLGYKRKLYQQQGLTAFVIVDPQDQTVVIDRRQSDGSYSTETANESVTFIVCDDCAIEFSIKTLFR